MALNFSELKVPWRDGYLTDDDVVEYEFLQHTNDMDFYAVDIKGFTPTDYIIERMPGLYPKYNNRIHLMEVKGVKQAVVYYHE
jgi:hypothetical protein